jgi:hypothetical protein
VDEQCRITVVGERRRADLAVPAVAPIASYVTTLARVCGQGGDPVLLSAWSLGPAVGAPFAPERSLGELGVLDGSVLYLRDVIEGEYADPVVYDVGERVAEVAERRLHRRWNARTRNVAVMAIGLGWLIAALIVLAVRHLVGHAVTAEVSVMFGVLLPALGWTIGERGWPIPPRLREAMSLSAVPLLALAAWAIFSSHHFSHLYGPQGHLTHGGLAVAAVVVGALIGAILAYAAAPSPTTCMVLLTAAVAAVVGIGLAAAKADGIASVTVAAVIAFALLTLAPKVAAWSVAFSDRQARARGERNDGDTDPVATAVSTAATLLIVWSGCLAAALAVVLVPMAASRSPYPAAAAGCLGLGLLLRAGAARLTAEVLPLLVAGAAGLLTLLLIGPGHLGWPHYVSPLGAVVIAVIAIIYGFRRLMRSPDLPSADRPRWLGGFGSMLGGTGAALAIAALGAFSHLVSLGHHL